MVQFCSQLEVMQSLKEQLEQRTRMIEANIQRQQDELRQIQDELQRVQGQSLQVRLRSLWPNRFIMLCVVLYLLFGFTDVASEGVRICDVCFRCSCRKEPED